jgi:2C-methyl-D-erythritol 2,4-cyclodiphosphate synthase
MKLFKNCSAIDVGELNNQTNFNKVFENNLDGTIELAMEVLDFNGFFSLNILTILVKKIPMLAPMEESIQQALSEMKKN